MAPVVMLEVFLALVDRVGSLVDQVGSLVLVGRVDSLVLVDPAGLVITMTVQQWRKWIRRVSSH